MGGKRVLFHIGFPKCGSTSIQFALESAPDIDYAGFLPSKRAGLYWKSEDLAKLFDRELRFSCGTPDHYSSVITNYIERSAQRTVMFSSENISLRFLPWDVPTHLKLSYLKSIVPVDAEFILVYKNPVHIFKSLYKEWVLLGYNGTFSGFVSDVFSYRDISFFYDLCLGKFIKRFSACFDLMKLHILFLDNEDMSNRLSEIAGSRIVLATDPANRSVSDKEVVEIQKKSVDRNDYSPFFDTIEFHRAYFDCIDEGRKYSTAIKRRDRKLLVNSDDFDENCRHDKIGINNADVIDYLIADLESCIDRLASVNHKSYSRLLSYVEALSEYK